MSHLPDFLVALQEFRDLPGGTRLMGNPQRKRFE